ncbi:hypothetical protein, partial [Streptomyces sp. SID3343]|uniref:hypothetical protein n=1 Tax=Streptomyces sp. SID3343 TaxID=2690260 RepID=UPI00136FF3C7
AGPGRGKPTEPARALAATAAGDRVDRVDGPLRIACGQPLPVRPTSAAFDGTEVAITKVTYPSAYGPPEVSYRLRFAVAATRRAGHVEPQVLVLRDGVVVGGPRPAATAVEPPHGMKRVGESEWPAKTTITLDESAPTSLCGLTDWAAIRSDPTRYRIAVVLSPPRRGTQPAPAGPLMMAQTGVEPA